ncbi:hypothetical protein LXA43DRAFT_1186165 [Ganoderma leucocontextum]|nr:hypothetical protein LXA43DRAFT_1186165 [Ganoderma leucocontextum]
MAGRDRDRGLPTRVARQSWVFSWPPSLSLQAHPPHYHIQRALHTFSQRANLKNCTTCLRPTWFSAEACCCCCFGKFHQWHLPVRLISYTHGFLHLLNHGRTEAQNERIFDIANVPFEHVPEDEKKQFAGDIKKTGSYTGYKL